MGDLKDKAKEKIEDAANAAKKTSAHCDTSNEVSRAKDLLKETGAEDISSAGEKAVSSHGVNT